jgi:hypothetical protein
MDDIVVQWFRTSAGGLIVLRPPAVVKVAEIDGLLVGTCERPDLLAYSEAGSVVGLTREVRAHLSFMWDTYALGDPAALDGKARELGETLRGMAVGGGGR